MNWNAIKQFNFTWAIPGGAWLEDSSGYRNWESFTTIQQHLGQIWIDRQMRKQGWMTGCWIDVDNGSRVDRPTEIAKGVIEYPDGHFRCNI